MCTSTRLVFNKYIKRFVRVNCGHCPACQQAAANKRAARIRNNASYGTLPLSVTLTYSNDFVPYINLDEVASDDFLLVHRNKTIHYANSHDSSRHRLFVKNGSTSLFELKDDFKPSVLDNVFPLRNMSDSVGLCIYSDAQKFIKRLRINLKRHYNYERKFSYYLCSEYGRKRHRPHFHILIFVPTEFEHVFRSAIAESWSYDDKRFLQRSIEVAKNMASYLSGYVNKSAGFSPLFTQGDFKQKHSYSRGFGTMLAAFSLGSILEKIEQRTLTYTGTTFKNGGVSELIDIPIPSYVINRHFPRFKGFSRLDADSAISLISEPQRLLEFVRGIDRYHLSDIDYTPDDLHEIYVSLDNAYHRYADVTGLDRVCYAHHFVQAWHVHAMDSLRSFYENKDHIPVAHLYDNIDDFMVNPAISPNLESYFQSRGYPRELDPNRFTYRKQTSSRLADLFHKKESQRLTTNIVMADNLNLNV